MGDEGHWTGRWRTSALVAGIAIGAVLLRLVALEGRVAHWDEARIAFWALQYKSTGVWTYHPVFHGPLLLHVQRFVFSVLGPSDFAMRLPTAIVGGMLPAVAWLYRDHLGKDEIVAMALLLAANPILVYYSRFMRNDVLVATFTLATLGFVLRAVATGQARYGVGAGLCFAAALGSKENALLYLLAWIGAATLLLAWRYRRLGANVNGWSPLQEVIPAAELSSYLRHGTVAAIVMLPLLWLIYLPRGSGPGTLQGLLDDPGTLPATLNAGLLVPPQKAISFWALGSAQGEYPYYVFFGLLLGLLAVGAFGTLLLAAIGTQEVRQSDRARPLVTFAAFWAVLSAIGYPAAADLMAGWIALHVVIPLTIPAAVGLATVWDRSEDWRGEVPGRSAVKTLIVAYLVLTVGFTSFVAPGSVYNPIGQPSQMDASAGETIDAMEARIDGHGTDVAYVGSYWESLVHRLPFLWYVERNGGERRFVDDLEALGSDAPPVIVTHAERQGAINSRYPTYTCSAHERVPWEGGHPSGLPGEVMVCIEE